MRQTSGSRHSSAIFCKDLTLRLTTLLLSSTILASSLCSDEDDGSGSWLS